MFKKIAIACLAVSLTSCAMKPENYGQTSEGDPLESFNRNVYAFNKTMDDYVLRPVAVAYDTVTPEVVDDGIDNFFSNLGEINTIANDLLQGKFAQSGSDTLRFLVNSTIGLLGFIDVASAMGLEKHDEDFGQTLAMWGVNSGPYIMLPFFGPTTLRDLPNEVFEYYLDPVNEIDEDKYRYGVKGVGFINMRQGLLEYDDLLKESFDEYIFVRDAYLKNRNFKVYDGKPPVKLDDLDMNSLEECDPEFDELC